MSRGRAQQLYAAAVQHSRLRSLLLPCCAQQIALADPRKRLSQPLFPLPCRYVQHARHIEVQIFGDGSGNVVAFPERECSIQVGVGGWLGGEGGGTAQLVHRPHSSLTAGWLPGRMRRCLHGRPSSARHAAVRQGCLAARPLQRRHQKILEETPSPFVTPELRERLQGAAIRLGQKAKYR